MKLLALFFLSLLTLLSPHAVTKTQKAPAPAVLSTQSTAGTPSGTSQCHAKQVNPQDPQSYLPDGICTPGVTTPLVTQDNINQTICQPGYTKTIRPKAEYTNQLKYQQIQQYGYEDTNPKDYEEDHLISLELGGSPTDPKNLWPEPHPSVNEKDRVEDYLHKQVCLGQITLQQAQTEISQNWYQAYQQLSQ